VKTHVARHCMRPRQLLRSVAAMLASDGSAYSRLNLTLVRTYVLGDRWQGDGNSVRIVTDASLGGRGVSPVAIEARRP
jgi:hypothetical protein